LKLTAVLALSVSAWQAMPGTPMASCLGETLPAAALAARRGIDAAQWEGLQRMGFTAETLCHARGSIIEKALRRLVPGPHGPRPDGPAEYVEWRNLSLRDERGEIDPEGLLRARAHVDEMRAAQAQLPDQPEISRTSWTSIGPGNIGGRIRALVIHPTSTDTMFIGSVGGGIWKTTNGGDSWSPVDDFMANLAVSSMVIQPGTPSTMYAGTGEGFYNGDGLRGAGLFKSTDGGTTWSQLASTSTAPGAGMTAADFHYINRVAMSAGGGVLAVATSTGIFRSINGGSTFSKATMVGGGAIAPGNGVMDLDFHPSNGNLLVATLHAGVALYSTDAGSTWTTATGLPANANQVFGQRIETAYAPLDGSIVYASVDLDGGSLYKSTNGGQSYTEVFDGLADTTLNPLGAQGWYDNMLFVSNGSDLVVWGGIDLFRTTNGGSSFTKISQWFSHNYSNPTSAHADQHIGVAHPGYNGTTNRIVFFGNDGGIYKASDVTTVGGGASYQNGWTELNNGLAITQFYGGAGHPGSGKITAGTQDNGTLFYNPALGSAAENWTAPFGGDGGFSAYDSSDANYFYGEYVYAQIHRNTSGANSSSSYIYSGLTDAGTTNAEFIAAFVKDPADNNRLLVAALRLWRTTNAKAATPTWESIKATLNLNDRISAIGVTAQNANVIYAAHNSGRLYRTNSGAAAAATVLSSWQTIDDNGAANPLPNRRITRVTVGDAVNGLHPVYVTFGGFSGDNIYRSLDGGNTWANITGPTNGATALPDVPVRDLEIHPNRPDWLYAATEVGIFASTDGGTTWSLPHDGPANVSVDELFFLNTKLYAVTHGRGLFSTDTVSTFTDDPLVAGSTAIKAVHITELRSRINAIRSTLGLGTYSYTDPTLTANATIVKAVHVTDLITALSQAYTVAGRTPPIYSGTTPAIGGHALATTLSQLRAAVLAIE